MDGERARTLLKFELKLSDGLGEEEDGASRIYRGRPLVPVGGFNRD